MRLPLTIPVFLNTFITAAHSCGFPGCHRVLVLDGNMKNRRDVCYAKVAGFIQFDGLSGSIKTGCPATPAFKNRYCSLHVNHACELRAAEEDKELGVPTGTHYELAKRNDTQEILSPR